MSNRWDHGDHEQVRAGEPYLQAILRATSDGFWMLDAAGRIVEVNDTYCAMSGYSRAEVLGMSIAELADESQADAAARIQRIMTKGSELFEARHRRRDGTIWPVQVSCSWLDADGGRLVCFGRDASGREEREARIRLLIRILDAAPLSITVHDTDGRFLFVNRATATMHGCASVTELQERGLRGLDVPESQRLMEERMRLIAERGEARFEVAHYRKDGSVFPLEVHATSAEWEGRPVILSVATDITERRRAEDSLRHSHELMQYIIEHANAAVAVHDRNLRYVYVSRRYLDSYGITEDVIGRHHYDVFPDLPQKWRDVHRRALAGEVCGADRDPYPRADGTVDWTRWECRPWYDADGDIGGIIVYTELITERVQAEEALRRSEHTFRSYVENSPIGIFVLDADGRLIDANRAACNVSGYAREELIGRNVAELVVPGQRAAVRDRLRSLFEQGRVSVELPFASKDGQEIYCRVDATLLPEERVLCFAADVTERRQAEDALRQFKTMFDIANFGAALVTLDGRLLYVNARFAGDHGFEPEELIGKSLNLLHTESQMRQIRQLTRELRAGQSFGPVEVWHRHRDGTEFPMLMTGSVIRDATGAPECVAATAIDIRDRRALEARLAQAQKMESVGRLAGGVAHDFNNMLGVILGYADMALEQLPPDGPVVDCLREVKSAAGRSAEITRQLLGFARKQTIEPRVLDLDRTVEGMLRMLRRLIGEDIELIWRPGAPWPVLMDPSQLDQVLANLCVNGRDAIEGVGRITIETGAATLDEAYCAVHPGFVPGEFVLLSVSDDGRGMDRETMDRLFEPFFTTKAAGKGTGLGLATVYGIVKQNQGFIAAYSELGQGTTFSIYLPPHKEAVAPAAAEEVPAMPGARPGETVLLAEDEPAILRLASRMLTQLGYTVLAADTPEEAIELARQHPGGIDLLVTDVIMPGMNGRELAQRMAALRPGIRQLFVSGYPAAAIAHHGVLAEGVHFLQKPFGLPDLAARVRRALDT